MFIIGKQEVGIYSYLVALDNILVDLYYCCTVLISVCLTGERMDQYWFIIIERYYLILKKTCFFVYRSSFVYRTIKTPKYHFECVWQGYAWLYWCVWLKRCRILRFKVTRLFLLAVVVVFVYDVCGTRTCMVILVNLIKRMQNIKI